MGLFDNIDEIDSGIASDLRDSSANPPEFHSTGDDLFGKSDSFGSSFGSDPFGGFSNPTSPFGSDPFGSPFGAQQPPQKEQKDVMDRVLEGSLEGAKTSWTGIKWLGSNIAPTFKDVTPEGWHKFGATLVSRGWLLFILGIILSMCHIFVSSINNTFGIMLSGLITLGSGYAFKYLNLENAKEWQLKSGLTGITYSTTKPLPMEKVYDDGRVEDVDTEFNNDNFNFSSPMEENNEDINWGTDSDDDENSSDIWFDDDADDDDFNYDDDDYYDEDEEGESLGDYQDDYSYTAIEDPMDLEEAIEEIPEIHPGTQSRAFLLEQYCKVMENITPDFRDMEVVEEGSSIFDKYNTMIYSIAKRNSIELEKINFYLQEIRDCKFLTQLVITAGKAFKADIFSKAIEDLEKNDEYGRVVDNNIFTTFSERGNETFINIIKGKSPMVSIKDVWKDSWDYFSDASNEMPVVIGVSELGDPLYTDFAKVNTLAVSGKPRKGKTWAAEFIVAQLCMFTSPKNLNIYIADTKEGGGSSWSYLNLPHVKSIKYNIHEVLKMFEDILDNESKRRKELFNKYKVDKIQKMHTRHPEIEMPYIYIVIDEMTAFASRMQSYDKDTKTKFDNYLKIFTTEMPFLGIRLVLIPHRMKAPTIDKNVVENVEAKVVVASSEDEIKDALGVTKKTFPYSIVNKVGRAAIQVPGINDGLVSYAQTTVLSSDDESFRNVYSFMEAIWRKLEPDYVKQEEERKLPKVSLKSVIEDSDSSELDALLADED